MVCFLLLISSFIMLRECAVYEFGLWHYTKSSFVWFWYQEHEQYSKFFGWSSLQLSSYTWRIPLHMGCRAGQKPLMMEACGQNSLCTSSGAAYSLCPFSVKENKGVPSIFEQISLYYSTARLSLRMPFNLSRT